MCVHVVGSIGPSHFSSTPWFHSYSVPTPSFHAIPFPHHSLTGLFRQTSTVWAPAASVKLNCPLRDVSVLSCRNEVEGTVGLRIAWDWGGRGARRRCGRGLAGRAPGRQARAAPPARGRPDIYTVRFICPKGRADRHTRTIHSLPDLQLRPDVVFPWLHALKALNPMSVHCLSCFANCPLFFDGADFYV